MSPTPGPGVLRPKGRAVEDGPQGLDADVFRMECRPRRRGGEQGKVHLVGIENTPEADPVARDAFTERPRRARVHRCLSKGKKVAAELWHQTGCREEHEIGTWHSWSHDCIESMPLEIANLGQQRGPKTPVVKPPGIRHVDLLSLGVANGGGAERASRRTIPACRLSPGWPPSRFHLAEEPS